MKRCLSVFIAFALMLSTVPHVFAVDASRSTEKEISVESVLRFEGVVDSDTINQRSANQSTISSVDISLETEAAENVVLTMQGNGLQIRESGKLYIYDEGLYSGKRVVFVPAEGSKVQTLRFNDSGDGLYAKVTQNSDQIVVNAQVTESQFEALYAKGTEAKRLMIENGDYVRCDYLAELVAADLGFSCSDNAVSGQTASNSNISMRSYTKPSYSNLKSFLRALSNNPNTWLSIGNYGISNAFLTTEEFTVFNNNNNDTVFLCAKKTAYTNGFYYTRIGLLDLVYQSIPGSGGHRDVKLDACIGNGLMLEYDAQQQKARLYVDSFSPLFYNVQPSVAMTSGNTNNIFISNEISGQVQRTNVNVLSLFSVLPKVGWVATVFSSLETDGTCAFTSGERIYKTTVDEQLVTYGGVLREVSFNAQKAYLYDIGDHILMTAKEKYTSTMSSMKYAWRTSAALNSESILF